MDWRAEFERLAKVRIDPEIFVFCSNVYHHAARLNMPVENPAAKPLFVDAGKEYALADIPLNRGMLAVVKELREQGYSDDVKHAVTMRLMHFGEIFGKDELEPFQRKCDRTDVVEVSDALVKACASARFIFEGERMRFDVADLARIAHQLTEDDERKAAAK
jgi:hypothetical protein